MYDGSTEIDDWRPRLRRTSHGMGRDISPPPDNDSTVFLRGTFVMIVRALVT